MKKSHLLRSYFVLLLIVLCLGLVLHCIFERRVRNGIEKQSLMSLVYAADSLITTTQVSAATARQISENGEFHDLSNMNASDDSTTFYYSGYEVQQELSSILPVQHTISQSNYFIYMQNSDYVISRTVFASLSSYAKNTLDFTGSEDDLRAFLQDSSNFLRFIPMHSASFDQSGYLYIVPVSTALYAFNYNSVLVYVFSEEYIQDIFSSLTRDDPSEILMTDRSGRIFLSFVTEGMDAVDLPTLQEHAVEGQAVRFETEDADTSMCVVSCSTSDKIYTCYSVKPYDIFYYSSTNMGVLFAMIVAIALTIGLILAVVMTRIGSRQIEHVNSELTRTSSELVEKRTELTKKESELTQKTSELSQKESELHTLSERVQEQKPAAIESYVRRIMEGQIQSVEEQNKAASVLNLDIPGYKYQVLYMEVTSNNGELPADAKSLDNAVRKMIEHYFPSTGYYFKPSKRVYAVLLAADANRSNEEVIAGTRDSFQKLHDSLLSSYDLWAVGGLGMFNTMSAFLWKSYQQAKEAKSLCTHDKILISDLDYAKASDVYYYPESLSVQLLGFISSGNRRQVEEVFKLIMRENTELRSLSPQQRQWLCAAVRGSLMRKRQSIDETSLPEDKKKLLDHIDMIFSEEVSLNSLRNAALQLCDIFAGKKRGNDLISEIQEYIHHHYDDPDLSLTKISSVFHISENYFSAMFKKEMKENYSSYLERLRMVKAKELICETDIPLSEIYQHVGYNNPTSFRRVFKKNFDVSPSEMRRSAGFEKKRQNSPMTDHREAGQEAGDGIYRQKKGQQY